MKKMKSCIFAFAIIFLFTSCIQKEEPQTMVETYQTPELPEVYTPTLDDEKKVQLALERRREQNHIRKGDYMMSKNNPKEALKFYLPILKKLPDDIYLYKKVADAYLGMKDWKNAYAHYVRVPLSELSETDILHMITALFSLQDTYDRTEELQKFSFTQEQKEYFSTINQCYEGMQQCADILWNYEGQEPRLLALQQILRDANKISDDIAYRNLLFAQKLYEQRMFRLVGMITSEILANNPNYQEAKKMRAFSLYELGKYEDAREIMLSYFSENPDDMEVIIRLGEIYTFLEDYSTANLYFNNAIVSGYTPKTILERRLAYNYAKVGDTEGMKKVLTYLLQEEDAAEDDFSVAISLAFEKKEYERAYSWAYAGISRFPKSKILVPLYVQSLRLFGKPLDAERYIAGLPQDFQDLPMVQLEKGILLFDAEKFEEAKMIFQELEGYDNLADFAMEAEGYLRHIAEWEKEKAEQTRSGSGTETTSDEIPVQKSQDFWNS